MNNLSPLAEKNYFINLIGSGISMIEKTVNVVIRIGNDRKYLLRLSNISIEKCLGNETLYLINVSFGKTMRSCLQTHNHEKLFTKSNSSL